MHAEYRPPSVPGVSDHKLGLWVPLPVPPHLPCQVYTVVGLKYATSSRGGVSSPAASSGTVVNDPGFGYRTALAEIRRGLAQRWPAAVLAWRIAMVARFTVLSVLARCCKSNCTAAFLRSVAVNFSHRCGVCIDGGCFNTKHKCDVQPG